MSASMTPNDRSRPAGNGAAPNTTSQIADSNPIGVGWRNCVGQAATLLAQLGRRRDAARRLVPLDCGCPDPWPCRCTEPPLSERALDGWRDAAMTLLRAELIPLVPLEVRRALWRRGGADRVLAELLHDACGGEAA